MVLEDGTSALVSNESVLDLTKTRIVFMPKQNFQCLHSRCTLKCLNSHHNFSTDLKFKSICALPNQVGAWGKNRRNYQKFEEELEKRMPTLDVEN
jgi:hypothetical protein